MRLSVCLCGRPCAQLSVYLCASLCVCVHVCFSGCMCAEYFELDGSHVMLVFWNPTDSFLPFCFFPSFLRSFLSVETRSPTEQPISQLVTQAFQLFVIPTGRAFPRAQASGRGYQVWLSAGVIGNGEGRRQAPADHLLLFIHSFIQ